MIKSLRIHQLIPISIIGSCLVVTGCGTATTNKALIAPPCPQGAITVEVSEDGGPMLKNVHCKIRGRNTPISCPTTDAIALTCLDPEILLDPDSLTVEFCKDGYFCGAFRLEDERDLIPGLDFRLLMLAPRTNGSRTSQSFACSNTKARLIRIENPDGIGIPGVDIYLLDPEGETFLGKTDASGRYCVAEDLQLSSESALLACRNAFFCGLLTNDDLPAPARTFVLRLARFAIS